MSEMIERVAKAIYERYESYPRYAVAQMNGVLAEDLANAAIEAMREPTETMLEAWVSDSAPTTAMAELTWKAMIDAALEKQPA